MWDYALPARVDDSPHKAAGALLCEISLSYILCSEARLSKSLQMGFRSPPEREEVYCLVLACAACFCTVEVLISAALLP